MSSSFSPSLRNVVLRLRLNLVTTLGATLMFSAGGLAASAQTTFTCSTESGSNCALSVGSSQTSSSSSSFTVPTAGTISTISVELNGVWALTSSTNFYSMQAAEFLLTGPGGEYELLGATGDGADGADDTNNYDDQANGLHGLNIIIKDGAAAAPMGCVSVCSSGETSAWPAGNGTATGNTTGNLGSAGTTNDTVRPGSYFGYNPSTHDNPPPLGVLGDWPDTDGCNPDPILTTYNNAVNCTSPPTLTSKYGTTTANGTWTLTVINGNGVTSPISITNWSVTITYASLTSTTTTISNPTNPSIAGNPVTFTANVSATSTPTGSVTFTSNGATICSSVGLNGSGQATCSTSALGQGNNAIEASYTPTGNFGSSNATMTQLVEVTASQSGNKWCNSGQISAPGNSAGLQYPSFIHVTGYPNGSTVGGNLTVELVNATGPSGVNAYHLLVSPNGQNLDFFDSTFSYNQPSSPVNLTIFDTAGATPSGSSPPSTGSYDPYDGNGNGIANDGFPSSLSPSIDSSIPQVPGTINRAGPLAGTSLTNFQKAFSGALANGDWALYTYAGGGESEAIQGGWCVTLDVNTGVGTTTSVVASPNPQTTGQTATITATVLAGGSPVNSGTVTFLDNNAVPAGVSSNTVSLNGSGQASITTSSLAEGDHTITATYNGTSSDNGSYGTVVQRINDATTLYANGATISHGPTCGATYCYCNGGSISTTASYKGAFTPNPSVIDVTNLPGTIGSVTLGLNQYSSASTILYSLESMVVSPTGADLDYFSNAGWSSGGGTASLGNYIFSDSASSEISSSVSTLSPGTYKPTSFVEGDSANWPEPAQPYFSGYYTPPSAITYAGPRASGTFTSQFENTNPDGLWSLYMTEDDPAGVASSAYGWCVNLTENPVTVSLDMGHQGNGVGTDFVQSENGAQITAVVQAASNTGPTGDPLGTNPMKVVDTLPTGLTYSSFSGTNWSCSASGQTVNCTNDSAVSAGASYSTLTLLVNVASNAAASISNVISTSGAGTTAITNQSDTITVDKTPVLSVSKSHAGSFTQGSTGEWDITVSNTASGSATSGTVTVSDTLYTGYTLASYTSTSSLWTCSGTGTVTCTATPGIAGGSSSTINLFVNIPTNSPTSVNNSAQAWGGGDTVHASQGTAATSNNSSVAVNQVPSTITVAGGNNQSATLGTEFGSELVAVVKDGAGATIVGSPVIFTVNPAGNGAGATFSNSTGTITQNTNNGGQAAVLITANSVPGAYTVTAQAGSASTTFSLTNTYVAVPTAVNVSAPSAAYAGGPISFTVTVYDQYSNVDTSYADTLQFTSTDTAATFPVSSSTLTNGTGTFNVTLNTIGNQTITATDISTPTITATSGSIVVTMPYLVVTTNGDTTTGVATNCAVQPAAGSGTGICSLRDALAEAANLGVGDISFDGTAFSASNSTAQNTITLPNGTLTIPANTSITGPTSGSGYTLSDLVTLDGGGAVGVFYTTSAGVTVSNLAIQNGNSEYGGGIFNYSGTVTVTNSTFTNNVASTWGGAILSYGTTTVTGSTFSGNSAGQYGGGILNYAGTTTITNSTFTQNSAPEGGGGILNNGQTTVSSSTIDGNSTTSGGGGILNFNSLSLANSVITGNTNGGSGTDDVDDSSEQGGNFWNGSNVINGNLIGAYNGTPQNGTNVNLAPLYNYGGPTQTMIPLPGSPAICGGLASNIPSGTTTDERGFPTTNTTYAGYSPTTPCVDAGAVQTNYAISFTTQPPSSGTTGAALNPAPVVTLTESGTVFTAGPGTIAISDADADLNGSSTISVSTTAGAASFSNLKFTNAESGDTLTAMVALNPAISATSPAISSVSNPFNLAAPPFGNLDLVADSVTKSSTVGQLDLVLVQGWVADKVDGAPLSNINVYVDGNLISLAGAPILGGARPGVAAAYGAAYLHSEFQMIFSASILAMGSHAVTVVAIDSGGRSTTLGPLNITAATITGPPFGHLDSVADSVKGSNTVRPPDSVVVRGFAADQVDGAPLSNLNVYVDGNPVALSGPPILGGARPGVAAAYGAAYLNSEFQLTFSSSTLALGPHAVTVVATNSGGRSTTLGPLNFAVSPTVKPPFGHLDLVADSVTKSSTVGQLDLVLVQGWAADQADGAPLSNVNVYVDGNLVTLSGAPVLGGVRPGVAAAYGAAYLHSEFQMSFSASTLAMGSHAVTVVATDSGGRSTTLGPINITVATITAPPFGYLDTVADSVTGSTTVGQLDSVVVKGWAADQVDGAPLSNVNVYVDGNPVALAGPPILGGARPGVAAAYGAAYLNSEFQLTFSASTLALGPHAVTVVAIDSGGRSTTLGPLAFTVQ